MASFWRVLRSFCHSCQNIPVCLPTIKLVLGFFLLLLKWIWSEVVTHFFFKSVAKTCKSIANWNCHYQAGQLSFPATVNGILLPKLFWPTVRKNCLKDREKLCKIFKITGTIYSNSERSERFCVTEYFFNFSYLFLNPNNFFQSKF